MLRDCNEMSVIPLNAIFAYIWFVFGIAIMHEKVAAKLTSHTKGISPYKITIPYA